MPIEITEQHRERAELEIIKQIAKVCGWVWYILPQDKLSPDRKYRCLYHPLIINRELSLADGTEKDCNEAYQINDGMLSFSWKRQRLLE